MAEGGYPSVYVVDSYATGPPLPPKPPKPAQGRRRSGGAQTLLFLLVSVALCGMAIEACFIFHLYQPESATPVSPSKLIAGEGRAAEGQNRVILPSKPVAHLTDGQDVVHGKEIMAWSMNAEPLLYKMGYKDGSLIIMQEGYYYVYAKVSYFGKVFFDHSVERKTKLYLGESIPLLKSRKSSKQSYRIRSNSYLGGVFHLNKDDALFVKVRNTTQLARGKSVENVFGAYMI